MAGSAQTPVDDPYQSLRQQVLERFLNGQFAPGTRFYSVREVAQWPSATAHLAQRVLQEMCKEGYLESVPKKGLFVRDPSKRARPAPEEGGRQLQFLIPPGSNQSRVNELLPLISQGLDPELWRIEVVYLRPDYNSEGGFRFAERLINRRPTAVIWLMPQPGDMLLIRYLVTSGIPVVTYNRDFSATGAMGVVADVRAVAAQLFDRVWSQGKRRIACLQVDRPSPSIRTFADTVTAVARERGVGDAYRHLLLPYADGEHFLTDVVRDEVAALMDGPDRPDGVVCAESFSLLAIESWLADHRNVKVPQELAIASFDRMRLDQVIRVLPPIPRGDFDHQAMMRAAVEMLDMELSGRRVEEKVRMVSAVILD